MRSSHDEAHVALQSNHNDVFLPFIFKRFCRYEGVANVRRSHLSHARLINGLL